MKVKRAYDTTDDTLLMQLAAKGERDAFAQLYQRYYAKLVAFCSRMLDGDRQKAEDIVQEIFIRIIDKPGAYDPAQTFSTWIYTIGSNLCLNQLRNEQNRRKLNEENQLRQSSAYNMHTQHDLALAKERIREALRQSSEKERLLFTLRYEHELGIKEIAGIAGMPEGSVKSGIFYLLKKIATQLKDLKHSH